MTIRIALALLLISAFCGGASVADEPMRVVVVTGGHDFDEVPFVGMLDSIEDAEVTQVKIGAGEDLFGNIDEWDYDVIVLYNMTASMSEGARGNFLTLLDRGVGLVVLHHAMAAFSEWPEFRNVAGVWYHLQETEEGGEVYPASTYQHDVDMSVRIEAPDHPVTRGVGDFTVRDETYKGYTLVPGNTLLLTCDHATSQREIGWTREYAKARIVVMQPGHGPGIFGIEAYRRLVSNAIQWVAGN